MRLHNYAWIGSERLWRKLRALLHSVQGLVKIAYKFSTHRQATKMVRGFYMFVVIFVLYPENDEGNYVYYVLFSRTHSRYGHMVIAVA